MAREGFHRRLAGFFESSQRAGCSHELPQVKQRFTFCFLHFRLLLLVELGFALQRRGREAAHEKQMPFVARWGDCPAAPSRGSGVWRSLERSGKPLTEGADGAG